MIKLQKNSLYIVVASSLLLLFCLVYQGTYSYFAVGVTDKREDQNKIHELTSVDLQNLTLITNSNTGSDRLIPGESITTTFSIENPSSVTMCFNLLWKDVINTFENKQDLYVTLTDSEGNVLVNNEQFPTTDGLLKEKISLNSKKTETYNLNVLYNETEENQFGDMGKSFSGKITGILTSCN